MLYFLKGLTTEMTPGDRICDFFGILLFFQKYNTRLPPAIVEFEGLNKVVRVKAEQFRGNRLKDGERGFAFGDIWLDGKL
jgi:hypothetical protein